MDKILALDLGTSTGWASCTLPPPDAVSAVDAIEHGVFSIAPQTKNAIEHHAERYVRFRDQIRYLLKTVKPTIVVYEQIQFHARNAAYAAHMYGALEAILLQEVYAYDPELRYVGIHTSTIKKHIAGKGNANKTELQPALESMGFHIQSHDERDAVAILLTAMYSGIVIMKDRERNG